MSKICHTCRSQNIFKSKKIKESKWRNKKYPNIANIESYKLKIGDEYKNKFIYYWGAFGKSKYNNCNSGLTKVSNTGYITIHLQKPTSYIYKKKKYPAHIHFIIQNSKTSWKKKEFTFSVQ